MLEMLRQMSVCVCVNGSCVSRVPADEDRASAAQHLHDPLPAVDERHRENLPRGEQ